MTIGFSGLGRMGEPMAMNLLKSGRPLIVHARRAAACARLVEAGATGTTDLRDLAAADVVFLCLSDGEAVEDVVHRLLPDLRAGQVVVDTSTIDHATTLRIARALAAREVAFLDAPISGMRQRAIDGTLTVMCGGDADTLERVRPLLALMGNTILHMGPVGNGQLVKLVNQLLFDINVAALAELLPMAVKMGLDPVQVGEVVNRGTGRSYASEFFVPRILAGDFGQGYPLEDAYKDLVGGAELGAQRRIPLPVLAAATATYQAALLQGHGASDKGAMIRVFEDLLGVRFRQSGTSG